MYNVDMNLLQNLSRVELETEYRAALLELGTLSSIIERYREALEEIAEEECCRTPGCSTGDPMCTAMTARAALAKEMET